MPGSMVGRGAPPPATSAAADATVTLPSGEKFDGQLERVDDFVVSLKTADGDTAIVSHRRRRPGDVTDPLQPHRDLLRTYTDADIHNVTAYLSTLK